MSTGPITSIPGATIFPLEPPRTKFPFLSNGSFFGAHPCFWPFWAIPTLEVCISTLNFGPFSKKLGGTFRAIKKMTQNDNGPGLGRNYGETDVFTFGQKVFFWPKMNFNPKNHPKFLKRLIFIWEKETFFFYTSLPPLHRLPVTAQALSVRKPFGLDDIHHNTIQEKVGP